jgi:branched-chain amino acid transport system permease protein
VVESLGSVFIDSGLRNVYGFIFLILVLLVRPTGLFGEKERLS